MGSARENNPTYPHVYPVDMTLATASYSSNQPAGIKRPINENVQFCSSTNELDSLSVCNPMQVDELNLTDINHRNEQNTSECYFDWPSKMRPLEAQRYMCAARSLLLHDLLSNMRNGSDLLYPLPSMQPSFCKSCLGQSIYHVNLSDLFIKTFTNLLSHCR